MTSRLLGFTTLLTLAIVAQGTAARGQMYYYPQGYGGWGGWGGMYGGETAFGANARGMGAFAAGAGAYNLDTAQARAINVDTTMRLNEYIWQSQQIRNRRYYERLAARREQVNETAEQTYARLREGSSPADIRSGDALNVALDELTDPRVYIDSLESAQASVPSALVKAIPFQYAPWAVTVSLGELTRSGLPEALRENQEIEARRQALEEVLARVETQVEGEGAVSDETLTEAQAAIKELHTAIHATVPPGPERSESDNFLKGLYGLTRMLQAPQFDVFLKELDEVEETTLAHLINFMHAFNLRFGVAETEEQQAAYTQLFPMLDTLRDEVNPEGSSPLVEGPARERGAPPFSDMRFEDFEPQPPLGSSQPTETEPAPPTDQPTTTPDQPTTTPDQPLAPATDQQQPTPPGR